MAVCGGEGSDVVFSHHSNNRRMRLRLAKVAYKCHRPLY